MGEQIRSESIHLHDSICGHSLSGREQACRCDRESKPYHVNISRPETPRSSISFRMQGSFQNTSTYFKCTALIYSFIGQAVVSLRSNHIESLNRPSFSHFRKYSSSFFTMFQAITIPLNAIAQLRQSCPQHC